MGMKPSSEKIPCCWWFGPHNVDVWTVRIDSHPLPIALQTMLISSFNRRTIGFTTDDTLQQLCHWAWFVPGEVEKWESVLDTKVARWFALPGPIDDFVYVCHTIFWATRGHLMGLDSKGLKQVCRRSDCGCTNMYQLYPTMKRRLIMGLAKVTKVKNIVQLSCHIAGSETPDLQPWTPDSCEVLNWLNMVK